MPYTLKADDLGYNAEFGECEGWRNGGFMWDQLLVVGMKDGDMRVDRWN